jgi:DNA repair protein RadC
MSIKDWPSDERPRERLRRHGAAALSDAELLAIFLRVGIKGSSAVDLARALLHRFDGNLAKLSVATPEQLAALPGIGPAKASQFAATLELARRSLQAGMAQRDAMGSPGLVRDWLRLKLAHLAHEVFGALWLDAQNRLIAYEELFRGTLTQTSVYPREVVKHALSCNAAAVILAHNHPSGVCEPSHADQALTRALQQALALVDVKLLDHFVIAGNEAVSLAERGLL